jgi:flagellar biosynthesis/type III secretory pathway M-ring protein FliF/YscJ
MHDALTALARAAADATPTPTPTMVDPDLVTPGPWGFVIIALVGLAVIVLVWDMMRRIRRGRVRADIREELEAEEQAAAAMEATDVDDQVTDAGSDADGMPPRG